MGETFVPYFDFRDYPTGITGKVTAALGEAANSRQFILGESVAAFEADFAAKLGTACAIGVGNGYDALVVALKAVGIKPGDEVIVPANTFIATVNAVVQSGGTPVFAEPDAHTYNITAATAEAKITAATKAIIPVHLYGQVCEMEPLLQLAKEANLKLIEDTAQAHGASYKGKKAGTFGNVGTFSFYPTKNLGAMGDGGAVVTADAPLAAYMRMYRNYGESSKYYNEVVGVNSRLDTVQAAVLLAKLPYLEQLNAERQRLAQVYLSALQEVGDIVLPHTAPNCEHVYHIFSIHSGQRNKLQSWLLEQGIHTAIHYPVPVHLQPAYRHLGYRVGSLPVAERLAQTNLSLPLFPGMLEREQQQIITCIKKFFALA